MRIAITSLFVLGVLLASSVRADSLIEGVAAESEADHLLKRYPAGLALGVSFGHADAGGASRGAHQFYYLNNRENPVWAALNNWTPQFRVNADDDWGWCSLSFAILDPRNEYPNLKVYADFEPSRGADAGQCQNTGEYLIHRTSTEPNFGRVMILNMDSRPGGCEITFRLEGAPAVKLQLEIYPDDDGVGQCPDNPVKNTPKLFEASVGNPLKIRLDTDGRYGGCVLKFRLAVS